MGKTSHRGRPLCKYQACDVETAPGQKFCPAHQWRIVKWIKKSEEALARALERQAQEVA